MAALADRRELTGNLDFFTLQQHFSNLEIEERKSRVRENGLNAVMTQNAVTARVKAYEHFIACICPHPPDGNTSVNLS